MKGAIVMNEKQYVMRVGHLIYDAVVYAHLLERKMECVRINNKGKLANNEAYQRLSKEYDKVISAIANTVDISNTKDFENIIAGYDEYKDNSLIEVAVSVLQNACQNESDEVRQVIPLSICFCTKSNLLINI